MGLLGDETMHLLSVGFINHPQMPQSWNPFLNEVILTRRWSVFVGKVAARNYPALIKNHFYDLLSKQGWRAEKIATRDQEDKVGLQKSRSCEGAPVNRTRSVMQASRRRGSEEALMDMFCSTDVSFKPKCTLCINDPTLPSSSAPIEGRSDGDREKPDQRGERGGEIEEVEWGMWSRETKQKGCSMTCSQHWCCIDAVHCKQTLICQSRNTFNIFNYQLYSICMKEWTEALFQNKVQSTMTEKKSRNFYLCSYYSLIIIFFKFK